MCVVVCVVVCFVVFVFRFVCYWCFSCFAVAAGVVVDTVALGKTNNTSKRKNKIYKQS